MQTIKRRSFDCWSSLDPQGIGRKYFSCTAKYNPIITCSTCAGRSDCAGVRAIHQARDFCIFVMSWLDSWQISSRRLAVGQISKIPHCGIRRGHGDRRCALVLPVTILTCAVLRPARGDWFPLQPQQLQRQVQRLSSETPLVKEAYFSLLQIYQRELLSCSSAVHT